MMKRWGMVILIVALTLGVAASALASGRRIYCYSANANDPCPFWGASYSGMRFQTNVEQSRIRYAGSINEVEYYNYDGASGRYNNYRVYLCHTTRTSLSTTFGVNYYAAPVLVASRSAFTIPAVRGWFGLRMTRSFAYDNVRHLLIEIRWEGDNAISVPIYNNDPLSGNRRVWAVNDPNAETGRGDGRAYYTRLNFGYYTAVEPTSLGRVKAIFE
ncbi:MAG TPA: hypothetical protein VMX79_01855 [bacterium]|nr:hypothetical protein [bacterium]